MDIDYVLERGVAEIIPGKKELKKLLNSRIRLYQGFDPTADSLHIGNFIGLRKLSQFQKLGHEVIFLIGDFTAMIGDPTDKTSARQKLTKKEVKDNFKNYKEQAGKVLDFKGENPAKVMFNSNWLSKLNFEDILELTSNFTVQQMIERDFFQRRLESKKPIFIHEFLYPIMQGYDALEMEVDLEIGGNDQLFNMLPGRTLLKNKKNKEKHVLTLKLLEDNSGEKMSKSVGNVVWMNDNPNEMYGKIMSFSDDLLSSATELLTDLSYENVSKDPMKSKKTLAHDVVRQLHSESDAQKAQSYFEETFQKGITPDDILKIQIDNDTLEAVDLIEKTNLVKSRSQIKRLLEEGAITSDNKKINVNETIKIRDGIVIKIGKKRFVKILKK